MPTLSTTALKAAVALAALAAAVPVGVALADEDAPDGLGSPTEQVCDVGAEASALTTPLGR